MRIMGETSYVPPGSIINKGRVKIDFKKVDFNFFSQKIKGDKNWNSAL